MHLWDHKSNSFSNAMYQAMHVENAVVVFLEGLGCPNKVGSLEDKL